MKDKSSRELQRVGKEDQIRYAADPWRHWEVRLCPHRESHRGAGKGILGKGNREP